VNEPPELDYASPRNSKPQKTAAQISFAAIGVAIYLILALGCLALVIFIPLAGRVLPLVSGIASVLFFFQAIRSIWRVIRGKQAI
jgi:uncharacterized membrane protein